MKIQTIRIADVGRFEGQDVRMQGWLYSKRSSKKLHFLQLRDGSGIIQAVLSLQDAGERLFELASSLGQESSIRVDGTVVQDTRSAIGFELQVKNIEVVSASEGYPISKKSHGDAFLMDHRHLWLRSKRQNLIMRIRHTLVRAIRDYFDHRDYVLVDSPILTPNACEGTSTLFETPYFDKKAYLTQSGQLYQEAGAMAFGKSYCFGPTFRAEKSKTRRHLTEFWMVEPEVAFMELEGTMDLAEDFLCNLVSRVLEVHHRDLPDVLERDIAPLSAIQAPFPRLSYDDAVEKIVQIREKTDDPELKKQLALDWGADFGSPHETQLTRAFSQPVIVHGFPSAIKAFYMKQDSSRPDVSRSMDVLAPEGYGEIIGGGQREDDLVTLEAGIAKHDLDPKSFSWFTDLRRYGSVPHAGFGMGLERAVAWICGLHHVRETIPFARTLDRLSP